MCIDNYSAGRSTGHNRQPSRQDRAPKYDKAHGYLLRWQQDHNDVSMSSPSDSSTSGTDGVNRPLSTWQLLSGNVPVDRLSISIYLGKQQSHMNKQQAHSPGQLAVAIHQGMCVTASCLFLKTGLTEMFCHATPNFNSLLDLHCNAFRDVSMWCTSSTRACFSTQTV
jgi:hypothetical protein